MPLGRVRWVPIIAACTCGVHPSLGDAVLKFARTLKLGAWVQSSVRRIVLHLPASCVHRNDSRGLRYRVCIFALTASTHFLMSRSRSASASAVLGIPHLRSDQVSRSLLGATQGAIARGSWTEFTVQVRGRRLLLRQEDTSWKTATASPIWVRRCPNRMAKCVRLTGPWRLESVAGSRLTRRG
jgi:hypothetical protein